MYHHRDGVLIRGVSKTQVGAMLDGGHPLAKEPQPKNWQDAGQPPTHSSFMNMSRPATSRHVDGMGGVVLRDAMALGRAPLSPPPAKAKPSRPAQSKFIDHSAPGANKSRRV
jgi:hypothetical protein